MPAIVDRDPVTVAISTAGTAPLLARRLRERIESVLPARLGALARLAEAFRGAVRGQLERASDRRQFWEDLIDGPAADAVFAGDDAGGREAALRLLNSGGPARSGRVAIVGAGPGDPDLLTFRALRLMQRADVVLHDRLLGPGMLDLVRRDALRVDVGKANGHHRVSQDGINELMLGHARAGRRVVRLKGGDPMIFGRGGEEVVWLRANGIKVEVVPGVTAALGAAAETGMALTHRGLASAVTFVTGHGSASAPDLDWKALASSGATLVVYMGVGEAGRIAPRLIDHGLSATTPVAVIENATRSNRRAFHVTLGDLATLITDKSVVGPAIIVIGAVAAAESLAVAESAVRETHGILARAV